MKVKSPVKIQENCRKWIWRVRAMALVVITMTKWIREVKDQVAVSRILTTPTMKMTMMVGPPFTRMRTA